MLRGIIITRLALERFRSAEIYAVVGDLINEIAKTDIIIAGVIINVPTAFAHELWQKSNAVELCQRFYTDKFSKRYRVIDHSCAS